MITSGVDIFVQLPFLPCFGPCLTQPEKRVLTRPFPPQESRQSFTVAAVSLKMVTLIPEHFSDMRGQENLWHYWLKIKGWVQDLKNFFIFPLSDKSLVSE